jgi:prepilin-type N-terminal cleavage/methylation domain-containing protein
MFISLSSKKKGFSLVELLIVIAIIGIITTVVLANVARAKANSRDGKRITDISQLQLALALYLDKNEQYPIGNSIATLSALIAPDKFVDKIATDPINDSLHKYGYTSDGFSYCLGASLENTADPRIETPIPCTTDQASNNYLVKK